MRGLPSAIITANRYAAAAAKSLRSCPTLCDPIDGTPPGSPSLGFSRQEHWSGFLFPSPVHKSESEVAQSCPPLRDPMDCSLPGSSTHGIFQARVLEWGAIAFSILCPFCSLNVFSPHSPFLTSFGLIYFPLLHIPWFEKYALFYSLLRNFNIYCFKMYFLT